MSLLKFLVETGRVKHLMYTPNITNNREILTSAVRYGYALTADDLRAISFRKATAPPSIVTAAREQARRRLQVLLLRGGSQHAQRDHR
jgi:hypothetical protein